MSVAQQEYTLKVTMEKSSSTAIQSIMVNNTVVDEDALSADPISVELPTTWYNNNALQQTKLDSLKVVITTEASVNKVTLAGKDGVKGNPANGSVTWTWDFTNATTQVGGVNLSKEQTISVFAQDGLLSP